MTFGTRVAKLRDEKGMSQKDLGLLVETGKDMISRYERGVIVPSLDVAGKIAKVLNVPLDFLVFGVTENPDGDDINLKLHEVARLPEEDRKHILAVIDAFLTRAKLQRILQ